MAISFQQNTITAITDIPALVKAFATGLGFTVGGTTSAPTVRNPASSSYLTFTLTASKASGSGYTLYDTLTWTGGTPANAAVMRSPRRATNSTDRNTLTPVQPTKLFLFGALSPQPYIAIVVCYGYNLYRHLYYGHMEAIGSYTGGEVVSACGQMDYYSLTAGTVPYNSYLHTYLFGARQTWLDTNSCGGVNVNHANNPTQFRKFLRGNGFSGTGTAVDDTCVLGGFGDQIADPYIARGKSLFAGANVLTPINLFAGRSGNTLSPLGRVPGLRLINMQGIDPEATISIGSSQWLIVPMFAKNSNQNITYSSYLNQTGETSYYVGLAYAKA